MKQKRKVAIICSIGAIIAIVFGISYALFSEILLGEKHYVLENNGLKIYLDESKHEENIHVENMFPTLDKDGMKNTAYQFSLVNESPVDLEYTIYLKEEQIENKTPSNFIRYHYTRDRDDIKITRTITENIKNESYYLESGIIASNTSYHYTLRMWLDYNADNSAMNTSYSVRLEIEATQTSGVYKEAILQGTDPVLTENLIPVIIEDSGVVRKADINEKWYAYEEKIWANAVVLTDKTITYKENEQIPEENIESYFVWIPRYKYKIFNDTIYSGLTTIENRVQEIEIAFENKEMQPSDGTKKDSWLTHPAFTTFNSNGFWIGKFESGYKGATVSTSSEVNSSDSTKLIIKPNAYSWRNISTGNAFKVSYDYLREEDSHMIKNSEWGAVASLQHSKYGSMTSVRNNNNSSLKTGYASVEEPTIGFSATSVAQNLFGTESSVTLPYHTETGYLASTTGNISGIYDMSGGSWEHVAGYNTKANTTGDKSNITNVYKDFFTNDAWKKYYDRYSNDSGEIVKYEVGLLGDATREMGPFGGVKDTDTVVRNRTSWYGDLAHSISNTHPWFERGGSYNNGIAAGVFAFSREEGQAHQNITFRVVLTPQ